MQKQTILIVDDSILNRRALSDVLNVDYNILEATDGLQAIDIIFKKSKEISLIILDIMMPHLNGIEVIKIIKGDSRTADIPVIMLTAADSNEEYCFKLGAIDFIKKPFNQNIVLSRVNAHIARIINTKPSNVEKGDPSFDVFAAILYKMTAIPDLKDVSTLERINRCRHITRIFIAEVCQRYGVEFESLSRSIIKISDMMPLRDIGKFMVPFDILYKEKITDTEYDEIKRHCEYGLKIISTFHNNDSTYCNFLADIIENHHEYFDGTGYPAQKKGSEISPVGRIAAIIDCYMAMTEKRAYRDAFSHEDALGYIISQKDKRYDGKLVDVFIGLPLKNNY